MVMKVSEIPYKRYTIEEGRSAFGSFKAAVAAAGSADDVIAARKTFLDEWRNYAEAASLSNCRFTLDTRSEFYQGEVAYYDENGPLFSQLMTEYGEIMLASPFRAELEAALGSRRFAFYELAKKTFSEKIIEDMQKENAVSTEYSKFMSELVFDFDGQKSAAADMKRYFDALDSPVRDFLQQLFGKVQSRRRRGDRPRIFGVNGLIVRFVFAVFGLLAVNVGRQRHDAVLFQSRKQR